jgi:hypothetical protein
MMATKDLKVVLVRGIVEKILLSDLANEDLNRIVDAIPLGQNWPGVQ